MKRRRDNEMGNIRLFLLWRRGNRCFSSAASSSIKLIDDGIYHTKRGRHGRVVISRARLIGAYPASQAKYKQWGCDTLPITQTIVPFGVTYEKIGTIQRRLAWPLHKDDTLSRSGRPTGLNIYCFCYFQFYDEADLLRSRHIHFLFFMD